MAVRTKKTFRQEIFGADMLGLDPGRGTVKIFLISNTQASPEDKEEFLQNLKSCLREAYNWTAAQLGVNKDELVEAIDSSTDG